MYEIRGCPRETRQLPANQRIHGLISFLVPLKCTCFLRALFSPPFLFGDKAFIRLVISLSNDLLNRQKDFLLEKYWHCVDDTYQKKDYLEWLKNRQIIDLPAFKAMQSELPKPAQPIGFQHS